MKDSNILSVRLDPELGLELDQLAEDMSMSRSMVVKKAVKHFVARQRHIDEVLQAARKSQDNYTATGRGVPWSEVYEWLRNGRDEQSRPRIRNMKSDD